MSDGNNETALPSFVHTFTSKDCGGRWRGRTVRIFKRAGRPFWYVQLVHEPNSRRQHRTRLKTESRTTAILLAIEVCDQVWSGAGARPLPAAEPDGAPGGRSPTVKELATVGEILAVYECKGPLRQKGRRTVPDNMNYVRLVVREGLGQPSMADASVEALRCDVFTATLARRFEEGRLARLDGKAADYRERRKSTLESVNAYLRGARSVLQKDFLPWYVEDAHLVLGVDGDGRSGRDGHPFQGFMEYKAEKPKKEAKRKPARELVQKTFEAAALLRQSDPPAYYAWLLGLHSLRRAEIQRCERSWLRREVLDDDADLFATGQECWVIRTDLGKSDRSRVIPLPDAVAEEIIAWHAADGQFREEFDRGFIIPAGRWYSYGSTESRPTGRYLGAGEGSELRAHGVTIRVNEWMRGLGWTTRKTLHEMRALFLRKARAQFGKRDEEALEATAKLGGHQDSRTTVQSYTGELSMRGKIVEFPLQGHFEQKGTKEAKG